MAENLAGAAVEIEDKTFYSQKEAAAALGVHFQTLRNWMNAGSIHTTRIGGPDSRPLVPRIELTRLLAKMEAKRATLEPSMDDNEVLKRVESLVGAENVYPLVKMLLARWLAERQAKMERAKTEEDEKAAAGAALHDVIVAEVVPEPAPATEKEKAQ